MNEPRMTYFENDDILHVSLAEGEEAQCVEITPDVTAELNGNGELIGIEILDASRFIRDSVVESVQAKLMGLTAGRPAHMVVAEGQTEYTAEKITIQGDDTDDD